MKAMILSRPAEDVIQKMSDYTKDAIALFQSYSISLDDKDRKGLRTMAEGRQGIAETMCRVAVNFEECLPRTENAQDMVAALDYHSKLAMLQTTLIKLFEMVDDTLVAQGVDVVKMYDRYNVHFQGARLHNSNLDMALQPIDDYNKRFANLKEEEEEQAKKDEGKDDTTKQ